MLTADNPATPNETISIFGTGFGLYDRPLVDGFPTPDTGDWNVVDPVKVTVGGQTYTPVSSRASNGLRRHGGGEGQTYRHAAFGPGRSEGNGRQRG